LKTFYDTIIISPHLDDAALSCGGQIYLMTADGESVLIVTLMAGEPPESDLSTFAQNLHDRWQLKSDAVARRRQEDMAAAHILGAETLHWEIPDCIYRRNLHTGEPYYISNQEIFGEYDLSEEVLINELAEHLITLPQFKQIYAPLGVGNHVDHQIARLAAERSFGEGLVYYEEYPYAIVPGAVDLIVSERLTEWQSQTIPIPEEVLAVKIEAIAAYISQLSTFFLHQSDLERQVHHYAQTVGGERIWRHDSSPGPSQKPAYR